jgi:outer membrane protein TolC
MADVALAEARQREREVFKQVRLIRSQLNRLLDLDIESQLKLQEPNLKLRSPARIEDLYGLAIDRRPENLALKTAMKQTEEAMVLARSRYFPRISAFAQYYREGEDLAASRNDFVNDHNGAVGVRVDWNWFEGGKTYSTLTELRHRLQAIEQRRRDLNDQVRIQVKDAFEALHVAEANLHTAETALKQAKESERITNSQYREQLVIFLEVLTAQLSVLQSRVNYFQALYGYQMAWADLERAAGGPIATSK